MNARMLPVIALTLVWTAAGAHDYMGMEPLIVDAKEIEAVGQLTEEQRNDEEFMDEFLLSYDEIYFQ